MQRVIGVDLVANEEADSNAIIQPTDGWVEQGAKVLATLSARAIIVPGGGGRGGGARRGQAGWHLLRGGRMGRRIGGQRGFGSILFVVYSYQYPIHYYE